MECPWPFLLFCWLHGKLILPRLKLTSGPENIMVDFILAMAGFLAQMVKNLPAMWETWVQSLSWKDPLEEGMATHSSILAWRIPMDRGTWWATVHGVTKSQAQLSD